jgi:hypothetical protein
MFEYYAYSISPSQAAAHGGHAMLSGGHAVLLKVSVPMCNDSRNEPGGGRYVCGAGGLWAAGALWPVCET